MRLKLILITLIVLVSQQLFAQSEANISQYYAVPTLFNPAATGRTDFVRIRGGARLQWVGIDNAPRTFIGAADMPFKLGNSRVGVGAVINQESIGLFSGLDLGVQASYKLRKWGGVWSIGLQIGFRDRVSKDRKYICPTATNITRAPTTPYRQATFTAQHSTALSAYGTITPNSTRDSRVRTSCRQL